MKTSQPVKITLEISEDLYKRIMEIHDYGAKQFDIGFGLNHTIKHLLKDGTEFAEEGMRRIQASLRLNEED